MSGGGRLDRLVREAREALGTRESRKVDWSAVDRGLFARIEAEQRDERARREESGRAGGVGGWAVGAAVLAAAAAIALVVGKTHESPSQAVYVEEEPAGTLASIDGDGAVLIDGRPALVGAVLHEGDTLETRGAATASLDRPGKVVYALSPASRARATHTRGCLVLALERGAVEAQVVPVASGEAFAVDVDGSRIAVHGTHLRVAVERAGDRVVLDLNEGVVSLGPAPRVGSTLGTLVTAPAHAEFLPADPRGTLTVTHDPAAVRAPLTLQAGGSTPPSSPDAFPAAKAPPKVLEAPAGRTEVLAPVAAHGAARAEARPESSAPASPAPSGAQGDPNAATALAASVRSCIAGHTSARNVTVAVSTTLHLDLTADGDVRAARFDPPLPAEATSCAAAFIYKTRFSHGGAVEIPVEVTVPSSAP